MRSRLIHWHGPDPPRIDAAAVTLADGALAAHGTSLTAGYTLAFRLTTGPGWVTRELDVQTEGGGWKRALHLRRSDDGEWTADAPLPDLSAALDCDLGLCPLTNTMPILRHDLIGAAHRGESGSFDFVMAWVSVPDLAVHRSEQRYAVSDAVDGGGAMVRFSSERFTTTLEVEADGLLVNYPGLGRLAGSC